MHDHQLHSRITRASIEDMVRHPPRRFRLCDFDRPLKPPGEYGDDWNLSFPFWESFVPAFQAACSVGHIDFRSSGGTLHFTFLKNVTDEEIEEVENWLSTVAPHVGLRDCLEMSFALDYDRKDGNPRNPHSDMGLLRTRAKPYSGSPTEDTYRAMRKLSKHCVDFLNRIRSYNSADAIVAVPPSDPSKKYNLAMELASGIAEDWEIEDLSHAVKTTMKRPGIKDRNLEDKLDTLTNTITLDSPSIRGKTIVIVDDLYQSGVSMNYVGMLLHLAGANDVLGLSCVKCCRNTDNTVEASE